MTFINNLRSNLRAFCSELVQNVEHFEYVRCKLKTKPIDVKAKFMISVVKRICKVIKKFYASKPVTFSRIDHECTKIPFSNVCRSIALRCWQYLYLGIL